ncbi:MAG TPA: hypothetical protein PLV31_03875 [Gammaproteobacteria bacterium]|nr:hypothetical protein [Gammaproteobacteria bacterium]HRA42811.1 hypothetical protein [Gammaproteobacteria bacterium]
MADTSSLLLELVLRLKDFLNSGVTLGRPLELRGEVSSKTLRILLSCASSSAGVEGVAYLLHPLIATQSSPKIK